MAPKKFPNSWNTPSQSKRMFSNILDIVKLDPYSIISKKLLKNDSLGYLKAYHEILKMPQNFKNASQCWEAIFQHFG